MWPIIIEKLDGKKMIRDERNEGRQIPSQIKKKFEPNMSKFLTSWDDLISLLSYQTMFIER